MTAIIGLDLSLTSTGVASSNGWVTRIKIPPSADKFTRHRKISNAVMDHCRDADLVVVEGMSLGTKPQPGLDQRAGLWWLTMEAIDGNDIPWIEVPPSTLKRYATGVGNASKDAVLAAAVRRFPAIDVTGNDEADALWLCQIGADLAGEPMVDMPAAHRAALVKLALPEAVAV